MMPFQGYRAYTIVHRRNTCNMCFIRLRLVSDRTVASHRFRVRTRTPRDQCGHKTATSDKASAAAQRSPQRTHGRSSACLALGLGCKLRSHHCQPRAPPTYSRVHTITTGPPQKHPAGWRACGHPLLFRAPRMQQRLVHCMLHCMMAVGIDASDGYLALHARHGTAGITTPRLML